MSSSTGTTTTTTLPRRVLQTSTRERIMDMVFDKSTTPAEYECCFGDAWPPRVKGWCIWDLAPGKAAHQLWNDKLFSYAKDLLNNTETDIEVDAALHAWMVGKDATRARPTVIIFSKSKPFREEARQILKTEVERHKFGVMTLSATISRDSGVPVFLDRNGPLPSQVYGVPITISTEIGHARCATIGGEICIDDRRYGVTVAHVFETQSKLSEASDDSSELEFDEYSDDEYEENKSKDSFDFEDFASFSSDEELGRRSEKKVAKEQRGDGLSRSTNVTIGYLEDPPKTHQSHDWALIDLIASIDSSDNIEELEHSFSKGKDRKIAIPTSFMTALGDKSAVSVATARGPWLHGHLNSSASALKLGSAEFADVWAVQLDQPTKPGDCGSWVVDGTEESLLGMLRGGFQSLAMAYLTPAYQIIQDLEKMYPDQRVYLPQKREPRRVGKEISPSLTTSEASKPFSLGRSRKLSPRVINQKDYYKTLEVEPQDTSAVIERSYIRLAMVTHPDDFPRDEEIAQKFKDISEAYEILKNERTRAQYDRDREIEEADHLGSTLDTKFGRIPSKFHTEEYSSVQSDEARDDLQGMFSAIDIIHAVRFAWDVYNLGWSEELNTSKQYEDFWNDVRSLAENLQDISRVVENAKATWIHQSLQLMRSPGLPSQKDWNLTSLREIIGDYHKTLTDCRKLLEENPEFRKNRNFAYNIEWNKVIQPKIELLRKRLEFHNTKILFLLRPLELNLLSEIHRDLANRIDAVHQTLLQLRGLLIPDVEQAISEQETVLVVDLDVPDEIESRFRLAAERSYPEIRTAGNFPLHAGADSFVEYFEESTKSFTAKGSFLDARTPPAQQYLALLKCIWIMRCLSNCEALRSASADSQWPGYVHQLREELSMECQRFKAPTPQAQRLIVPDLSGISNDVAYDIWPAENIADYMSRHTEERALEEVLKFPMPSQSESLHRELKILRLESTRYRLVESVEDKSTTPNSRQEFKMEIDLKTVNFMPLYAIPSSRPKALEVMIASPTEEITPTFLEPKHIFSLQHLLTGYKVYGRYDQAMVTVSFTIPGQPKPLEEHGRLQLWLPHPFRSSSTPSSGASSIAPSRFGNSRTSLGPGMETMSLNSRSERTPTRLVSPTSPLGPASSISFNMSRNSSSASSSRENAMSSRRGGPSALSVAGSINRSRTSTSTGDARESTTPSRTSSQSTTNKLTKTQRPPSIAPSTRTTSSVTSHTSMSSITTVTSHTSMSSITAVSTGTGRAQIHTKPAKPLLVIFLKSKEVTQKLAIVAIQVDEKTEVERERCGCRSSNSKCEDSCIERSGGSLLAQRWDADRLGSWNLAKLGVEQRKELPKDAWEDLKRVRLKFDSLEDRLRFSGKPCRCKPLMQHDLSTCVLEGHHGVFGIVKQTGSQNLRNYHQAREEAVGRSIELAPFLEHEY